MLNHEIQGAQSDPDSATFCQSIDNKDNWVRGVCGIYGINYLTTKQWVEVQLRPSKLVLQDLIKSRGSGRISMNIWQQDVNF